MFQLRTKSPPSDALTLREELEQSLRQIVQRPNGRMVTVEDRSYPDLTAIRISLDQAVAGDRPPARPTAIESTEEPALRVEHFEISGRPVRVQGAAIDLHCRAREVELRQGRDADGNVVLLLHKAAEGEVDISIPLADLEALVRDGATAAAKKQGVILEDVQVHLQSRTDRSLDVKVEVRARKLFLTAAVHMNGTLDIDEQLNARLSGLECVAEGTLGTLACGFLGPYLQRFEGRGFSLMALPIGEVKLRDVRLALGDKLRVTAKFGQAAA